MYIATRQFWDSFQEPVEQPLLVFRIAEEKPHRHNVLKTSVVPLALSNHLPNLLPYLLPNLWKQSKTLSFVHIFMHLAHSVQYVCLPAMPWHQRDFAPSTHPPK